MDKHRISVKKYKGKQSAPKKFNCGDFRKLKLTVDERGGGVGGGGKKITVPYFFIKINFVVTQPKSSDTTTARVMNNDRYLNGMR